MNNNRVKELLNKVLNGDAEGLSIQDKAILIENKEIIELELNAIFSDEIPKLQEDLDCFDPTALFWAFQLSGFLKLQATFEWAQKICSIPAEMLEDLFGFEFVTEELPFLLSTSSIQWKTLKNQIEDPDLDQFIRSSCLESLVHLVAIKEIEREEVIAYFKGLLDKIIVDDLDDEFLPSHLVNAIAKLWPGECIEEIRELFGLELIDTSYFGISFVINQLKKGKESCIQEALDHFNNHEFLPEFQELSEFKEDPSEKWKERFRVIDNLDKELAEDSNDLNRNSFCLCGSGKKYKKCCLNNPTPSNSASTIMLEPSMITYNAVHLDYLENLPSRDQAAIKAIYHLVKSNPEEALSECLFYISAYPNIPLLYNYLYAAHTKLDQPREAMITLNDSLKIFPDYLFARIEYALYLLRRNEPERAHSLLNNAKTLPELYPDKKVFHASEWKSFSVALSLCCIQKEDLTSAKAHLKIVQKLSPDGPEVDEIKYQMKNFLLNQILSET